MAVLKAGPEALDDLAAFLEPFSSLVRRSDLTRKTTSGERWWARREAARGCT